MSKQVLLEILKRSGLLAGVLAIGSLGTLLTLNAVWWETLAATVLVPVAGVVTKVLLAYFKNGGKLTVQQVDETFDQAQGDVKP
jgi:hypothetical protein